MKLIIGGTVALMAAIGIGFAMTQAKKKRAVPAAAPAVPAPVAQAPRAAPVIEAPAPMSEGAEEEAPASVSNPLRPHVRLLGVRTR